MLSWTGLVVGDDLAGLGDVLFDGGDLVRPVASGFIGVGNPGGVLALGLGQVVEEDFEVLLGSGAGHGRILNPSPGKCGGGPASTWLIFRIWTQLSSGTEDPFVKRQPLSIGISLVCAYVMASFSALRGISTSSAPS
jgi:hypothetical protein